MRDSYDFSDSKPNPYAERLKLLSQVVAGESASLNKSPEKNNAVPVTQSLGDCDVDDYKKSLEKGLALCGRSFFA